MHDMDDLEETKLLELLEAVESVLEQDDAEEELGADTISQFSDMRQLIRAWLRHESPLTRDQRLGLLEKFTNALAQKNLLLERIQARLH